MSNQKIKIPLVFADVFEFTSVLKKTSEFQCSGVLLMFLSDFSSRVRSEDFL